MTSTPRARVSHGEPRSTTAYMPPAAYAFTGESIVLNPRGVVARRDVDFFWDRPACTDAYGVLPASEGERISLSFVSGDVSETVVGSCAARVVPDQLPRTAPRYVLCLGDSTTRGMGGTVDGGWVRHAADLLQGKADVSFVGTLGTEGARHEGRPGWGLDHYLQCSERNGVSNPFFRETGFDLPSYLDANTDGISDDGSDLLLVLQLGWNNVYRQDDRAIIDLLREILESTLGSLSGLRVLVAGLTTPPDGNIARDYEEVRRVSAPTIMQDAVLRHARLCSSAITAVDPARAEFLPVAPFFFPADAYPTETRVVRSGPAELRFPVYTDYIHPNDAGYRQIAHVLAPAIAYLSLRHPHENKDD